MSTNLQFWVHGIPARSLEQVAQYLSGDDHDKSKVQVFDGETFHNATEMLEPSASRQTPLWTLYQRVTLGVPAPTFRKVGEFPHEEAAYLARDLELSKGIVHPEDLEVRREIRVG